MSRSSQSIKSNRSSPHLFMRTFPGVLALAISAAAVVTIAHAGESPQKASTVRFEDYHFSNPLRQDLQSGAITEAQASSLFYSNPKEFARRYYPKITLPVERKKFRGIWRYYDHSHSSSTLPYDGDASKPVYDGHSGTDFWTSFIDFGKTGESGNYLVNPFPKGADTFVTGIYDGVEDAPNQPVGSAGNHLYLTTYLNKTPEDCARAFPSGPALKQCIDDIPSWSKMSTRLLHLECGTVMINDVTGYPDNCAPAPSSRIQLPARVGSLQRLARIGYSGDAGLRGTHTHMEISPHLVDPFKGRYNTDISDSYFFDQNWVERIENFAGGGDPHFRINGSFFPQVTYQASNNYKFTSLSPIQRLWLTEKPGGVSVPSKTVDLLTTAVTTSAPEFSSRVEYDNDYRPYTLYSVSFKTKDNLLPQSGEWGVVAEDNRGKLSNTAFINVTGGAFKLSQLTLSPSRVNKNDSSNVMFRWNAKSYDKISRFQRKITRNGQCINPATGSSTSQCWSDWNVLATSSSNAPYSYTYNVELAPSSAYRNWQTGNYVISIKGEHATGVWSDEKTVNFYLQ
ncbi:hypothetical protein ONV78_16125 [Hahella sp. CR1]|uniref:hypothetical protein n=1 Tax=Hahella sp. CR1 TaxID=2992807 RepID=UPI0024432972|nr:hypothetical protein [Hahella sp. CR1]MDG9669270.1 hypothetical protein [Hahella sp. CR1]